MNVHVYTAPVYYVGDAMYTHSVNVVVYILWPIVFKGMALTGVHSCVVDGQWKSGVD